jgi:Rieske 2Fe-2S family protein
VGRPAPIDQRHVTDLARPFGSSRTLPASAYTSPEVHAWERAEIFDRTWVCLGRTDDLLAPGQVRAVEHDAESILLTRDGDGAVRGFSNVCRHRGHILVEPGEAIDARLIRCPYHSWSYRFDGSLRSAPTLTQPSITGAGDFDTGDWPLSAVAVGDLMGWLFLDLSGEAAPLGDAFRGLGELFAAYEPDRLSMVARHAYEVAANWKLIVENYHECYHCSTIHPELCQVSPPASGQDIQPDGLWCGGVMDLKDHAVTMSLTGASEGRNFRRLDADQARKVIYVGLWPNLLISAHPDYVLTHRIVPLGPGRSFVECDWLFAAESIDLDGFDPAYAVDFWDITNREDWNACEHVQKGAANRGFAPGPLSPWESTLHQFHSMVAAAYRGGPVLPPVVPASTRLEDVGS